MKGKWTKLLALLLVMVMTITYNPLHTFAAMDTINITFESNHPNATVSLIGKDNNPMGYSRSTGDSFYKGTTISSFINGIDVVNTDTNATFDGWALFQKVYMLDASNNNNLMLDSFGLPISGYQRVDNTLYQVSDILNYQVPVSSSTELMFKAQWNGQITGDTVGNNACVPADTVNLIFESCSPTAQTTLSYVYGNNNVGFGVGDFFKIGTKVNSLVQNISITNTDPNATFTGWLLCEKVAMRDNAGNPMVDSYGKPMYDWQPLGTTLYQVSDILNFDVTNSHSQLCFMAQWAGGSGGSNPGPGGNANNVNVVFLGNNPNAQVCIVNMDGTDRGYFQSVGDMFAVNSKISATIGNLKVKTTDGATFDGWRLCEKSESNGMVTWNPIDSKVYQTNEVLDYEVPSGYAELGFLAQWSGGSNPGPGGSGTKIQVDVFGNGGQIPITGGTYAGSLTNQIGNQFDIGSTLRSNGYVFTDPTTTNPGWTFMGWQVCTPSNQPNTPPTPVPGVNMMPTSQILDYEFPNFQICIMAQWDIGSGSGSGGNNPQPSGTMIELDLNGGSINLFGNATNGYSDFFEPNKTIAYTLSKDSNFVGINGSVQDPVFWTTNRSFEGWIAYTLKEVNDGQGHSWLERVEVPNLGLLTTAQVLGYKVTNEQTIFVAQWAGDDSDYYTNVVFEGYGEDITVTTKEWDNNTGQMVAVDRKFPGVGDYYRQTGDSIKWQMQNLYSMMFKAEPVKSGATLEGWLEYRFVADANGNEISRTPVSDKLYTTNEMLNSKVPVEDTVFVAKWSDIPLDQYEGFGNGGNGGSANSWGNLFMFANGGNFDYTYIDNGNLVKEEGFGIFVYEIDHDKAFKQCMDIYGDGLTDVYRTCGTLKGWTLYTCEMVELLYVEHGKDPAIGDPDLTMFLLVEDPELDTYVLLTKAEKTKGLVSLNDIYNLSGAREYFAVAEWEEKHTENDAVNENIKQPTATKNGSYDRVIYCKDCGVELSRETIETTMVSQEVVLPGIMNGVSARVDIVSSVTEVPEGIEEKYNSVDAIEDEMIKSALKANANFDVSEMKTILLDVELKVETSEGVWEVVTHDNFPEEGIYVTLPYPEGIKAEDFDFIITHMISEGARAGEVEVLEYTLEADGLRVRVTSLSPILIAYEEKSDEEKIDIPVVPPTGTTVVPPVALSPATGDQVPYYLYMCMLISGLGILFCFNKKSNKY